MSNPTPAFANGHSHHGDVADSIMTAGAKDSHDPKHHGHTIVPLRLLVGVLVILLVFTVLTVTAANAEEWFARTFNVVIPGWVNAVVALSIACVKSIIVAMYFMQLRYDHNPMNALVAVFTIMVATFFLGFIAIDLGNRGILYQYKADPVIPGGVGGFSRMGEDGKPDQIEAGKSIAVHAREKADRIIEEKLNKGEEITNHAYLIRLYNVYNELAATPNLPEPKQQLMAKMAAYMAQPQNKAEFEEVAAYVAAHSHGHAAAGGHGHGEANTANTSRAKTGLTLPEAGAAPDAHGGAGHTAPEHKAEPAAKEGHEPAKEAAPATKHEH
ncbi:MAG: cytochrome C oxidase subunit IV family protein [Phycisphaerales bacterium]